MWRGNRVNLLSLLPSCNRTALLMPFIYVRAFAAGLRVSQLLVLEVCNIEGFAATLLQVCKIKGFAAYY